MLSFFRRVFKSWMVLLVLLFVAAAMVVTGVGTPSGLGGGVTAGGGETIATMDGGSVGSVEATRRIRDALEQARQQQPEVDMAAFVQGGGVEGTLRRIVSAKAIEIWGRDHGFAASKRLIDGEIASIGAFHGPTGQFDEDVFRNVLARERISEAQLREDIAGDLIRRQVLGPIAGGTRASTELVKPYAAMLLEERRGLIGFVPAAAMPQGAQPSDAEINAFYRSNIGRFTLPERRVIRYAPIGAAQVANAAAPTEAEIAAAYRANAAQYAARQTRTLSQVLVPTEAAARAIVAKVRAGTSFAAAAQAAGFSPSDTALGAKTREEFAELSSPAVAAAAFSAQQGATTDPQRSPLGFHVVHVDAITDTPATPLSAVRETLAAEVAKRKTTDALATFVSKVEDAIADGATFDEAAKSNGLQVATTPPVLASGAAPGVAGWTPPQTFQPLLKAAFDAGEDDDPTVETLGPDSFALMDVSDVAPSAPVPLAKVRAEVARALVERRAADRARQVADAIVAKANRGVPLATAFTQAGVKLPAPEPAGGRQVDFAQSQAQVPPPLAMMFSMAPGKTRLLAAPDRGGWYVVRLDKVTPGDVGKAPQLVSATRQEFDRLLGGEFAEQFIAAIMKAVDVKQDQAAINRLRASLVQGGAEP